MKYKEITSSKLTEIRNQLLSQQQQKCRICQRQITEETGYAVDHQHCTKSEELGVNGAGLIRGVLCRNCNALEGKFWNASKRYPIPHVSEEPVKSRIQWLRNLADYLESNASTGVEILGDLVLHPSERRPLKLSKSQYNEIFKAFKDDAENYKKNGELKPFPKFNAKWSPKLQEFWDRYFKE